MARPSKPGKRTFGEVSKLPSGRYRARYTGPDQLRHSAPQTFDTKLDADGWLALRRADVMREEWTPPVTPGLRFGAYSRLWLAERELKPRTRQHYADILDRHLVEFNEVPLRRITPNMVSAWFAGLDTGPTMRAHTYSLLRTILNGSQQRIGVRPHRRAGVEAGEPRADHVGRDPAQGHLVEFDEVPIENVGVVLAGARLQLALGQPEPRVRAEPQPGRDRRRPFLPHHVGPAQRQPTVGVEFRVECLRRGVAKLIRPGVPGPVAAAREFGHFTESALAWLAGSRHEGVLRGESWGTPRLSVSLSVQGPYLDYPHVFAAHRQYPQVKGAATESRT